MAAKPGAKSLSKTKEENTSEVARWKDSCQRELRAFEKHHSSGGDRPFHVNPHCLASVTSKIGSRPPELSEMTSVERRELEETVSQMHHTPKQKFKAPATTAHDIGWFAAEASPEPFPNMLHRSPEVKFATAYARSFHVGPFQKTQPMAR